MEWGDKVVFLEDMARESGRVPKALAARPDIPADLEFVWDAFWRLSTDRPVGFSVGRIPFSAITAYADRYGIAGIDAFDRFEQLIRAMDRAFVQRAQSDKR